MAVHFLKTWPEYFTEVKEGRKKFEVRENDRNFQIGDKLVLQEFDPKNGYTEDVVEKEVTYIFHGGKFGVSEGTVIMGIE